MILNNIKGAYFNNKNINSIWSNNQKIFPPINNGNDSIPLGTPMEGGFFGGIMNPGQTGTHRYYLIVAPKANGFHSGLRWKTVNTTTPGTNSLWDGWNNSNNMNNSTHPAAQWCRSRNINGFNDWYLPAIDEAEILFRAFRPHTAWNNVTNSGINNNSEPIGELYTINNPQNTTLELFIPQGSEEFTGGGYHVSTELNTSSAYIQNYNNGARLNSWKFDTRPFRAVRRVFL